MSLKRPILVLAGLAVLAGSGAACAPTIKLEVAPIEIYAKLDADVRIRLDEEVKNLIEQNPELF